MAGRMKGLDQHLKPGRFDAVIVGQDQPAFARRHEARFPLRYMMVRSTVMHEVVEHGLRGLHQQVQQARITRLPDAQGCSLLVPDLSGR